MKILIPVASFQQLTGSEMYVYELAREQVFRGHQVTVAANRVGGVMAPHAKAAGIRVYPISQCPNEKFDLIHSQEPEPTKWALSRWPRTPILCTIHSQFPCERPVIDPRIWHYVCIRPEVQDKIVREGIARERTSVIYNPIDFARFYPQPESYHPEPTADWCPYPKRVLFVGTIDPLRKRTILDLISRAVVGQIRLTLVGKKADNNYDGYIDRRLPDGVTWHDQTWEIERFIHDCDETAGVFLGRSTIEGWACGKPGWIYDLDMHGRIRSRELFRPPLDMHRFDSRRVAVQLLDLYCACLAGELVH
jgi:glycosyltransferase involved in cell wall biosynthesis